MISLLAVIFLSQETLAGSKKTKKKTKSSNKGFDSKTLKCLVCRAVVDEFEAAIYKVGLFFAHLITCRFNSEMIYIDIHTFLIKINVVV